MTNATHTHRERGGKFQEIAQHQGAGTDLEGKWLVLYRDLDKGIDSITSLQEWESQWRALAPDDCPICLGAGYDHIKGNRDKPCGGCYGLGKVRDDGETPTDCWELASVATGIIQRQQEELLNLRRIAQTPEVQALIDQQRQQAIDNSIARQEQEWRRGKGFGPGGQRVTGD